MTVSLENPDAKTLGDALGIPAQRQVFLREKLEEYGKEFENPESKKFHDNTIIIDLCSNYGQTANEICYLSSLMSGLIIMLMESGPSGIIIAIPKEKGGVHEREN